MTKTRIVLVALVALLVLPAMSSAGGSKPAKETLTLPGLDKPAKVLRDTFGVPHVFAKSDHDAYFTVGWLHAQDRLFQMDATRRQASGTLAELLGSGALPSDVQLRTLGLRRAAARSQGAISPQSAAILQAYADGVNAWVGANPLPSEYTALELTKANVPAWTPLDSLAATKLLAFGLSFNANDDISNTQRLIAYQTAGAALGFDGAKLFSQDVMRSAPFAKVPSILPGETSGKPPKDDDDDDDDWNSSYKPNLAKAMEKALDRLDDAKLPMTAGDGGSNVWVVSGKRSSSGRATIANDPHLSLGSPSTFYEVGVDVDAKHDLSLYGVTFPGAPAVVQGTNGHVSWGSTVNPTDVTDVYQEQLTIAGGAPVATTYKGALEPTQIIPESYRANQLNGTVGDVVPVPPSASIPPATFVVPRRNNGPLVSVTGTTGLSVQFTGFSATREVDFFRLLSRADTVTEAIDAQRYFDFGAQNWMYVDDRGSIGYKTSGEIPLREDLQATTVAGLPPFFIRNGTGGNEWIADPTPAEDQATPFEILPFSEMDGLVNPKRGWIANANQDPTGQTFDNDPLNELRPGGGIRYLAPGHADGNRNARATARLEEAFSTGDRRVSFSEMQAIQADVQLHDAEVLVPYLKAALQAAQTPGAPPALAALGANPKVQEAVARIAAWKFSTPTGIPEGYDASDPNGFRLQPTQAEIDASVATTIYSLWRGQALAAIVDAPLAARGLGGFLPGSDQAMSSLRHLLETGGVGASGIAFYNGPVGRDTALLGALKNALDLAAGPGFAPAFGGSTNLADYRWGKLHRITFAHPLGGPFSIPPGAGFTDLSAALPGVATDGGFSVLDASSHNPRASTVSGFRFGSGPARRFVAEARSSHPKAVQVIPGGESGNPAGRWFGNQLGLWLTNDNKQVTTRRGDIDSILRQTLLPLGYSHSDDD